MKKHNGMRPQDIVILLKILTLKSDIWFIRDIALQLRISQSETSESIHRSAFSGLLSSGKKVVMKNSLMDFLEHGLQYVFPAQLGPVTRGVPTANSAEPLKSMISSNDNYVWPSSKGTSNGQSIYPLYHCVPDIVGENEKLYETLSLVEAIRIGKFRERQLGIKILREKM